MLVTTKLVKSLVALLRQIDKCNPTPFLFPIGAKSRVVKDGETDNRFEGRRKFVSTYWKYHILILFSGATSNAFMAKYEPGNFVSLCTHAFFTLVFCLYCMFAYAYHHKAEKLAKFFNEVTAFEKRQLRENAAEESTYWKSNALRKAVVLLNNFLRFLMFTMPWLFALSEVLVEAAPWRFVPSAIWNAFPNSFMFNGINLGYATVVLRSLVLFTYTFTLTSTLAGYILMVTIPSLLIPTSVLYFIVEFLQRKLRLSRLIDVDMPEVIKAYQETRLLLNLFNDVHQHGIIPGVIISATNGISIFLFVLISHWGNMDVQGGLLFANLSSLCISLIIIAFRFPVKLYIESESLLGCRGHYYRGVSERASRLTHQKERTMWNRCWKSFPILCVRFFGNNFFERGTPIVLLDYAIGLTINLLMMNK